MIKIGKLQVNSSISPKTFLILTLFSTLLFLILGGYTIINQIQTKDYIKVNATITEVGYHWVGSDDNESKINYIRFNFEYNNKTYSNEQRVTFRFNKNVGKSVDIYINPNNPNEIKDTYSTNLIFIACLFTLVTTLFLAKAYKIRKSQ